MFSTPRQKGLGKRRAQRDIRDNGEVIMVAKKKSGAVDKAMNKSQIVAEIVANTGVAKKDVAAIFGELESIIERHLNKKAVGQFTMPGLFKIKTRKMPARKAQKGVPNPFKPGEMMDVPARPATTRVRILPLKKVKEMPL